MNTLSDRLRDLRGHRSQAEFAKFLGIRSQQTYANYERGREPKTAILQQIARRCNVPYLWLATGTGQRQPLRDVITAESPPQSAGAARTLREDAARFGSHLDRAELDAVETLSTPALLDLVADMPDHIAHVTNATIRARLLDDSHRASQELRRRLNQ